MKSATIRELKLELKGKSHEELVDLCLHMSRFKKETKELLTYLLFEAQDEHQFIRGVQLEMDNEFGLINTQRTYFVKKSVRKILRNVKKHIRYSKKKETEGELLLSFCQKMSEVLPTFGANTVLNNIFLRQFALAQKAISTLHEDVQHDFAGEIEKLNDVVRRF